MSEPGADCLGLACTREGLFLGGTPLIERRAGRHVVRSKAELERLLGRGYSAAVGLERKMPGLALDAAGLAEGNLCLAQIAALHLCLPDLPDPSARAAIKGEDALIEAERGSSRLARGDWDPAKHPRTDAPPNPGWFAPTGDGAELPTQTAQGEEDKRAPEEMLEPEAPIRHALWQSGIATLREIDPGNPQLSSLTAPGWVPSPADLDTLDAAITAAKSSG